MADIKAKIGFDRNTEYIFDIDNLRKNKEIAREFINPLPPIQNISKGTGSIWVKDKSI